MALRDTGKGGEKENGHIRRESGQKSQEVQSVRSQKTSSGAVTSTQHRRGHHQTVSPGATPRDGDSHLPEQPEKGITPAVEGLFSGKFNQPRGQLEGTWNSLLSRLFPSVPAAAWSIQRLPVLPPAPSLGCDPGSTAWFLSPGFNNRTPFV